jgi:hypothetical protein
LIVAQLAIDIPKIHKKVAMARPDYSTLHHPRGAITYGDALVRSWRFKPRPHNLDDHALSLASCMTEAAVKIVPSLTATAKRPWISQRTLNLTDARNERRRFGNPEEVTRINKAIKVSAKADRRRWLDETVEKGGWQAVRGIRKGFAPKPGRLRDMSGNLVDSSARADTMADYLEKIQWCVCFADVVPRTSVAKKELAISVAPMSLSEIRKVVKRLRTSKAAGGDDVPPELWQALWHHDGALEILRELCDECWSRKEIPETWRQATVVSLFKKGDTSLPQNYRPIALLAIGYKVMAGILWIASKQEAPRRR